MTCVRWLALLLAATCLSSINGLHVKSSSDVFNLMVTVVSSSATLTFHDQTRGTSTTFDIAVSSTASPSECTQKKALICVQWGTQKLTVTAPKKKLKNQFRVKLTGGPSTTSHSLGSHHLYGGPVNNSWPAELIAYDYLPYVTNDEQIPEAVAERVWYTSAGVAINIGTDVPLFASQNSSMVSFRVKNDSPYSASAPETLIMNLCLTENVKEAWICFNPVGDKPVPPTWMVEKPIWSTWVAFKKLITQKKILKFASQIQAYNLSYSILEVDDAWETCYGSHVINTSQFPNAATMIEKLHKQGFRVTFWVHPFINVGCTAIDEDAEYLYQYDNGTVAYTEWWDGDGGMINFRKNKSVEWYINNLNNLKSMYGIDGFKFDAGEAGYIPALLSERPYVNPNSFTTAYATMASHLGTMSEVRCGAQTSKLKLFQRLQDVNSVWELNNHGLPSVITSTLTLTTLGYGAIMPDMIGGNVYGSEAATKEMFIRWVELNAFLPVLQFSLEPWSFDNETVDITREYIDLHYNHSSYIMELFKSTNPLPVIAPLWWIDPTDERALTVNDEFLLGDQILVAPVVTEGAVARDIFFPTGSWKDGMNGEIITGPTVIENYPAPLEKLPYFYKQ